MIRDRRLGFGRPLLPGDWRPSDLAPPEVPGVDYGGERLDDVPHGGPPLGEGLEAPVGQVGHLKELLGAVGAVQPGVRDLLPPNSLGAHRSLKVNAVRGSQSTAGEREKRETIGEADECQRKQTVMMMMMHMK